MKSNRDFLLMLTAQSQGQAYVTDTKLQYSAYNTNSLVGQMYEADKQGKDIRPYINQLYFEQLGRTL